MTLRLFAPLIPLLFAAASLSAQPCLTGWNLTANPPPTGGTYNAGQTVTFCFTVTGWNTTNANWFHGVVANFGPGWDMTTLVPGTPPPACGTSGGTWGWYNSVQGTGFNNIGPQGPGFFFDLNNDGIAGNNFGDFCTGSPTLQFCWTISVVSGAACTNGINLGVSFDTFSDSQTGSWGSVACTNDPIVPSAPAVTQCCDADAGTNASLTLCDTFAPVDLFTSLGGTPDVGGAWTTPTGAAHSGTFQPGVDAPGAYTYTVTDVACEATATVTVTVQQQPDAGTNGTITVCAGDPAFDLLTVLGGAPSAGGAWTGPTGQAVGNTFTPATSAPGTYTYTVSATPPCVAVSATVSVTVNPTPTAGTNGALAFCSNGPPAPLFDALGGVPDAGGSWTGPGGAAFNGIYDPAVNVPGTFTYTVQGVAPCPNSSATVTVTENLLPDAGSNGTATFCTTAPVVDLVSVLGGTPQAGGSWTGPGGAAVPGTIDPATAATGVYTYSITGVAPCPNAQATATVTIVTQPVAGTNGSLNLCNGSAAVDLFTALGGAPDAGGTWTGPTGQPVGSTFTPGTSAPGTYTYTLTAAPPCVNTQATVNVTVSPQPNAGTDNTLSVCSSGAPADLFPLLGPNAQQGGNWTGPSGAATTGTFTPGTSAPGAYTYTIVGVAPCITTSATVTVSVVQASNPGTNGTLTACTTGPAVDLFPLLGGNPQAGGTWTAPGGGASTGNVSPATAASGAYTYTLPANGPCPAVSSTVNVTIVQPPNAGTNGNVTLCSAPAQAYPLINGLGGTPQAGGSWTGPGGQAFGADFIPGISTPGTYTYTVDAPPPCAAASSTVTIAVVQAASAGSGGQVTICENAAPIDPATWLSGDPDAGGSWTAPGGAPVNVVDPATAASGTYTYTVTGTAPCPNVQATVQLTVSTLPNAGTDGVLALCADAPSSALIGSLSGADLGGTWTGPTGPSNGTFIPGTSAPGTYTYTVNGTGGCQGTSDQATVEVAVLPQPTPSFVVSTASGCAPLQVQFTLNDPVFLQSANWSFGNGATGNGVPGTFHTYDTPGNYTVAVTVTDLNGCSGSTSQANAVFVSGGPPAFFVPSPLVISIEDPVFDVTHEPQPGAEYAWTLNGQPIEGGSFFSQTITTNEVGFYPICLTATDALGCSNEFCVEILVDDVLTVFVPNAFTPDGNGINDEFRPSILGADLDRYLFLIFDRWGAEVFSTNDPNQGWNGAYRNSGAILPQGVYVWRLLVRDQFSTDQREYIGSVTLLK